MTLNDLKTGMYVRIANETYLVLRDCDTKVYGNQSILFINKNGFRDGTRYNNDMTCKNGNKHDITHVYSVMLNDDEEHYVHSLTLKPLFDDMTNFTCIWSRDDEFYG